MGYSQPAPPFCPPPEDAGLRQRVETLAQYAAKNGSAFVQTILERQGDNPEYSFLGGGEGAGYYAWVLHCATNGLNSKQPPARAQVAAPPAAAPPPAAPAQPEGLPAQQQQQQQQPVDPDLASLPVEVSSGWQQVLGMLTGSRDSIRNSQQWFLACAPYAAGMAEMMLQQMLHLGDYQKQLHVIYLANDILFKGLSQRAEGSGPDADGIAEAFKPRLGRMLRRAYLTSGQVAEAQQTLLRVMNFWAERGVFDHLSVEQMTMELMGISVDGTSASGAPGGAADGQQQQQQAGGAPAGVAAAAQAAAAAINQAAAMDAAGGGSAADQQQQQAPQQRTRWGQQPQDAAAGQQQPPARSRWGQQPPEAAAVTASQQQAQQQWSQQAPSPVAGQPQYPPQQAQQQWGQPAQGAAPGHPQQQQQQWAQQQAAGQFPPAGSAYPAAPPAMDGYYSHVPGGMQAAQQYGTVPPGMQAVQAQQYGAVPPGGAAHYPPPPGSHGAAPGYGTPPYPGQQAAYPPPGGAHGMAGQPPHGYAAPQYPGQQPPAGFYPPHGAPPGAYPPPPGAGPEVGYYPPPPVPEPEPEPECFDPFSFPPGLIPKLVEEKLKTDPPYSPLSILDIERTGVPPTPKVDAYLKSRVDKMYAQLADYRPGMLYSDIEVDAPRRGKHFSERDRGAGGGAGMGGAPLPPSMPDLPHAGLGLGPAPGAAMGFGPGGMPLSVDDGSFTGVRTARPGSFTGGSGLGYGSALAEQRQQREQDQQADAGGATAGVGGPGAAAAPAEAAPAADEGFNSYRYMRSKGYHQMIMDNSARKFGRG